MSDKTLSLPSTELTVQWGRQTNKSTVMQLSKCYLLNTIIQFSKCFYMEGHLSQTWQLPALGPRLQTSIVNSIVYNSELRIDNSYQCLLGARHSFPGH